MSRPTWVTVTGVLLIIFGILGMVGNIQAIFMPKFMDMQKGFFDSFRENAESKNPEAAKVFDEIEKMSEVPGWFPTWITIFGIIGVILMILYFTSGIVMLNLKPNAIRIANIALSFSILYALIQIIVASVFLESFLAMGMVMGGVISLIIDLVLIAVIYTHDKLVFEEQPIAMN